MKNMKMISTDNKIINSIGNTTIASSVASIIANPLFVLKVRKQTDLMNGRDQTGYLKKITHIYYNEGIRGYFKGMGATLFSNSKLALQFPLYDYIQYQSNNVFTASLLSKLISNSIL